MGLETAKYCVGGVLLFFALAELANRRFCFRNLSTRKDTILDIASVLLVPAIVIPSILYVSSQLAALFFPDTENQWSQWSPWLMFATLLVADDLTQYAWHRLSHTSWLYPLHRAHHSASYLSIRVVYRNNLIYYAMMPGLWLSGVLIHWGFIVVYPTYILVKMTVIISAHSSIPWDQPLHKNRYTRPLIWLIERIISTPSTHSMHHGLHEADGVTHYRGNYGNLLFIWDILFGTAKITRKRPAQFGIENLEPVSLSSEMFWPSAAKLKAATQEEEGSSTAHMDPHAS